MTVETTVHGLPGVPVYPGGSVAVEWVRSGGRAIPTRARVTDGAGRTRDTYRWCLETREWIKEEA